MKKSKHSQPAEAMPDFGICAHANLRKAMRIVSQAYDAALKPSGLRATQFTLLAVLANRGEMPITKLAEILMMDRTTLTRNLKPLLNNGWLAVGREKDERIRLISITEPGMQVMNEATPLWQDIHTRVAAGLGQKRLSTIIDDLDALIETVRTG